VPLQHHGRRETGNRDKGRHDRPDQQYSSNECKEKKDEDHWRQMRDHEGVLIWKNTACNFILQAVDEIEKLRVRFLKKEERLISALLIVSFT